MSISVKGAREHNLRGVDVEFGDGLTVVTGISGSGKTSLVFDTIYHEARRRFLEVFALGSSALRLAPADVQAITGLGPSVAVGQNLLNRNPGSTLASASGMHPFLRLLYARYGQRLCSGCGADLSMLTEDEIVETILRAAEAGPVTLVAPLARQVRGSHRTLSHMLAAEHGDTAIRVDGRPWSSQRLAAAQPHDIEVEIANISSGVSAADVRTAVRRVWGMGVQAITMESSDWRRTLSHAPVCSSCGSWFAEIEPTHFNRECPHCKGDGCERCAATGLLPAAAAVRWEGLRLPELLARSVHETRALFSSAELPSTARRLREEVGRRLEALDRVGLGYIALDRPSPTLSRGESQRVRLAVALTSRLEDMLHVLDEPTIGQHPADVARLLPAFRELRGPVIFVEHDRVAAAMADAAVDLGPGAGSEGGQLLFTGSPDQLWRQDTPTGRFFSLRQRVHVPERRPEPETFFTVRGAHLRNLCGIDVPIPLGRLSVITGVSGSGKSTFVEDVLVASLAKGEPCGCEGIDGPLLKPLMVDQSPIGRNPRSNPATYTKLADIVRDHYASQTGLSPSHFSFNRPEGACPDCNGIGATGVRMRYLPSTWITCASCEGQRFSDRVLAARVAFGDRRLSIADFYRLDVSQVTKLLLEQVGLPDKDQRAAGRILEALRDIGLGYIPLGQPSPTLSGGEAQRIKLAKYLGRRSLSDQLLVLDEPSTGLHPHDVSGLLTVLDRLVRRGATILVVEHNTDVVRAADWVVDLGPGAGPEGGQLLYAGPVKGLSQAEGSMTAQALKDEEAVRPQSGKAQAKGGTSLSRNTAVRIRGARAHNLRDVDIDIPKGALTVVTGVSGSGKSSLVGDVLEAEARRRYLESLSLYERQGTREGPEAPVDSVVGLGVAINVDAGVRRRDWGRRATVGSATEIGHHLAVLLAWLGERDCQECGTPMVRSDTWCCPSCAATAPIGGPRHFVTGNYAAACLTCNGVGSLRKPNPGKLIIHPDKPLCDGAMYSPGFFPKGYLCKPFNGGYYVVQAVAALYGFDPATTPWEEMSQDAQEAFLYGEAEPLEVHYENRKGNHQIRKQRYPGFYGWVSDWDVGGTYTDTLICPECKGGRLRPEYSAVTLGGHNRQALSEMPLSELNDVMVGRDVPTNMEGVVGQSLRTANRRLGFLTRVGLGYLHLDRLASSMSAGEAQRIKLAGLLGSELTSLTILLDEPSRGLHPSEVNALADVLAELRDEGNTVIVVEHDPVLIRSADLLVDMGPGAGAAGGEIVAQGSLEEVARADTTTGRWLRGEGRAGIDRPRRRGQGWMAIRGARANNLRGDTVRLPIVTLTGICGVSGSGKSTLIIDTLGRALAPKKQTTSVAYENVDPGDHDAIEGAPTRAILVDQTKAGMSSAAGFLGLTNPLHALYAASEDAQALGLDEGALKRRCSVCRGQGSVRIDMGFLPDVHTPCDTCRGTGYLAEAWNVRLHGLSLPEVFGLTIDQVHGLFGAEPKLIRPLQAARDVGLGYLVLRQPGYALSGGEAQRLKVAKELCRKTTAKTLYILDEPTLGQHLEDVARLVDVLHHLVDAGHTVLVVEHHAHLLASCDWLLELGPGGGPAGGHVVAQGTPELVAAGGSQTAPYLREVLAAHRSGA